MFRLILTFLALLLASPTLTAGTTLAECSLCNGPESYELKARQMYTGLEPVQQVYVFKTTPVRIKKFLVSNPTGGTFNYPIDSQDAQNSTNRPPAASRAYMPGLRVEEEPISSTELSLLQELIHAYAALKNELLEHDTTVSLTPFYLPGNIEITSVWDMVMVENEQLAMMSQMLEQMTLWQRFQAALNDWKAAISLTPPSSLRLVSLALEIPSNAWIARFIFPDDTSVLMAFPPGGLPQMINMADSEGRSIKFPSHAGSYQHLSFDVENNGWDNYLNWRRYLEFIGFDFESGVIGIDTVPNCVVTHIEETCRLLTDPETGQTRRVCTTKYTYECP